MSSLFSLFWLFVSVSVVWEQRKNQSQVARYVFRYLASKADCDADVELQWCCWTPVPKQRAPCKQTLSVIGRWIFSISNRTSSDVVRQAAFVDLFWRLCSFHLHLWCWGSNLPLYIFDQCLWISCECRSTSWSALSSLCLFIVSAVAAHDNFHSNTPPFL